MAIGFRMGGITPFVSVPNGKTVLPVNDVDLLLQCAGIKGSTITTLAELFADTTTLQAVINSNNAIDYLVRSTEFAKSEALVPTMTSNTTPSGEARCGDESSTNKAYKAFDGDITTNPTTTTSSNNKWIEYIFDSAVRVCKADYYVDYGTAPSSDKIKISHSVDGINYIVDISNVDIINRTKNTVSFQNNESARYWRIDVALGDAKAGFANEVQFYTEAGFTDNATAMTYIGANNYASNTLLANSTWLNAICNSTYFESVLNAKVPVMTSATTPSGEVIVSSYVSGMEGYKAFDNNTSTYWRVYGNNLNGAYIIYHFPTQVSVNKVVTSYVTSSGATVSATLWELYGSNNNTDYIDIGEVGANSAGTESILINNNKYAYYKLVCKHANVSSSVTYGFRDLQFYGRVDV